MRAFGEVISCWPSAVALAAELGVEPSTVRQWRRRGSVPAPYWRALIDRGTSRGIVGLDERLLAEIAARRRRPAVERRDRPAPAAAIEVAP